MNGISTVGLDLAKQVFEVHAVGGAGEVVLRKSLRRGQVTAFFAGLPPCLVGMEACATAHHWARELTALGHEVRLMPPQYVKAYRKRHKNDAADAAAICEAVTRPSMRFVPVKSEAQQAALTIHRTRDLLVRQRTMLINALRGHLAEFGVIAPQGPRHVAQLVAAVRDAAEPRVPELARRVLAMLVEQLEQLAAKLAVLGQELLAWHRASPASRRLATHPGDRAGDRQHPGGDGDRPRGLPQRAGIRGLAGAGAAARTRAAARRAWGGSASGAMPSCAGS